TRGASRPGTDDRRRTRRTAPAAEACRGVGDGARNPETSDGLLGEGVELVRIFEFIDRQKAEFPVKVLCAVCGVSRSGFYAWAARGPDEPDPEEETLA